MLFSNENIFKITEKTITVDIEGHKSFLQITRETNRQVSQPLF